MWQPNTAAALTGRAWNGTAGSAVYERVLCVVRFERVLYSAVVSKRVVQVRHGAQHVAVYAAVPCLRERRPERAPEHPSVVARLVAAEQRDSERKRMLLALF